MYFWYECFVTLHVKESLSPRRGSNVFWGRENPLGDVSVWAADFRPALSPHSGFLQTSAEERGPKRRVLNSSNFTAAYFD